MSKNNNLDIQTFGEKNGRVFLKPIKKFAQFPDLLDAQKKWFVQFIEYYLNKLFEEINPIEDIGWERLYLTITDLKVSMPEVDEETCKKKELTYWWIITWRVKLVNSQTGEVLFNKRANIWILPVMTKWWSYIINGVERVVINQIIRSFGLFFTYDRKTLTYSFKLIPEQWPWLEVTIEKSWNIVVRINKSRKFPVTSLLRVFGFETDESIKELFKDVFEEDDFDYISYTLQKDPTTNALDAAKYIYSKLRPGEIIDAESALDYIKSLFLDPTKIQLGRIARRKINAKLGIKKPLEWNEANIFDAEDLVAALKYLVSLANQKRGYYIDDIDHLANRRIRTMWEVLYNHLKPFVRRFAKSVRWKLSILNIEDNIKLTDIANFKIIDNAIKSFFATSPLSQFLDQTNPLCELEHKRRITALWPGGLKRETATFEVRDVHPSHYGRICPIETPEGQNIWLVIYQALYSRVNEDGFLETPAVRIAKEVNPKKEELIGRIADEDILDRKGNVIVKDNEYIDEKAAKKIEKEYSKLWKKIKVRPFLLKDKKTGEYVIDWIWPEMDEKVIIADATTPIDENGNILTKRVAWRHYMEMEMFHVNDITHMDVNPSQIFSANTSLIPFVDHDDAVRAAMGTNMQRQAVPLIKPEAPLVWTGLEWDVAEMTYAVIKAEDEGEVIYVDWSRVKVKYKNLWMKEYELITFRRSNQKTVIHQRPKVSLWDKVKKWDILAEGPSVVDWEIALWKNLRVAFMPWEWYNYEDAIVISERLVKDDELTSIHIEEYEVEVADTKLGPEITTNDIPGVSLSKLKNLDENGIVRIWTYVKGGDILVWKITPKSEWDLTPEEKLIQAIFGDKSKSYKDTSLYMPSWSEWKVIDVVILDSKKGDNLPAWIRQKIKVYVASTRKIEVWDKLAWRHWNKGIIAVVVPEEDMPFTKDGKPVDIVLNPLGVISRMNIWQTLETQLWLVAKALGKKFAVPLFSDFSTEDLKNLLVKVGLPEDGKMEIYDWRTWEKYKNKVTVWYMHILKLIHMVEDKIHARSVWPYSLITQQPLWGKAREWGQRFWEMEVWALEAYGAVYTLQEMLTIKSDDVIGRNKTYEAIIRWGKIKVWGLPESFNYLVFILKWLAQNIIPLTKDQIDKIHKERVEKIVKLWLRGITATPDEVKDELIVYEDKEEKKTVVDNVLEDMAEFGDLE